MADDKNENTENDHTETNKSAEENIWWKSWVSAAKSKSGEVLDFLKQDLNEISTTVKSETTNFISNTTSAIADGIQINNPEWSSTTNSVKESVSSIITQVGKAFIPPPIDDDEEPYIVQNDKVVSISKFQGKLYLLQAEPSTYLNDIEESLLTRYDAWLECLKNEEFDQLSNESLTKMLLTSTRLKENYEKLVPTKVSHGDFWNRYLFRKALLEDEEAEKHRKKSLEKKICDGLEWDKESFSSHISLSEEEQGQILKEYEKERSSTAESELAGKEIKSCRTSGSEESSVQSANDRESSSDDWEKDFDMEEIP